jgi:hypothetical protein
MDAQIYRFHSRAKPVFHDCDAFMAATRSAAGFLSWYSQAMFSFHASMVRAAVDAMRGMK